MPFVSQSVMEELAALRQLQADVNAGLWVRVPVTPPKTDGWVNIGTKALPIWRPEGWVDFPDRVGSETITTERTLAIVPPRGADDLPENIAEACKVFATSPKAVAANCRIARDMIKQGFHEEAILKQIQQGRAV